MAFGCSRDDTDTADNEGAESADALVPGSYESMDYGPVLAESIHQNWPEGALVRKGLAIRVHDDMALIFDTDLMRFAAGSTGGWLDLENTDYASFKGNDIPHIEGRQVFGSSEIAGWAKDGSFFGPREAGMGNLPREWAHYKGYYRHNDQIVLSYSVGGTNILELPGAEMYNDQTSGFVRTIHVEASGRPLQSLILEKHPDWTVVETRSTGDIIFETEEGALGVRLITPPENVTLVQVDERLELHLPTSNQSRTIRVIIFEMDTPEDPVFDEFLSKMEGRPLPDLNQFVQGGPAQWEETIEVTSTVEENGWAYTVDRIGVPLENPWGSWMKLSGIDFYEDGTRAAVSTANGDVWIVSGINESLENVQWKRYASGLFYPMGIVIVDGQIYVTERSQLTRLHDLNGNGEADFYENVNNDGVVHPMGHSLGLERDSKGNFYFFKNGNRIPAEIPLHGLLHRVSPDGMKREVFATGFRGSNTIGIDPDDRILTVDQEGNWVPVERINIVEQGKFYGYRPHGGEHLPVGEFETPIAWTPRNANNSAGSMTYAGDKRWGPLSGQWILGSYGQGSLLAVLTEDIGGELQGGVVRIPLDLKTGLMRGRMNPADGQLYVIGISSWGRASWDAGEAEDGSFLRIRYTDKPANFPVGLQAGNRPAGVEIEFTDPVDPASARDISNYTVSRWEYIYSRRYGSPEYSLENPMEEGHDNIDVASAVLSDDGKKIFLEIPDLRSVMQMEIEYNLKFADGSNAENAIYHTINWLSEAEVHNKPEWQQRILDGFRVVEERQSEPDVEPAFQGRDNLPEWVENGRRVFTTNCASCHVESAVAPSMNESKWAAGPHEALTRILLNGKRGERGMMIPFSWLSDEDLASLQSYVSSIAREEISEPVSASEIQEIRQATRDRTAPWTEEELEEFRLSL